MTTINQFINNTRLHVLWPRLGRPRESPVRVFPLPEPFPRHAPLSHLRQQVHSFFPRFSYTLITPICHYPLRYYYFFARRVQIAFLSVCFLSFFRPRPSLHLTLSLTCVFVPKFYPTQSRFTTTWTLSRLRLRL